MAQIAICCADIGSVQGGKFGWASCPEAADADHASPRSLVRFVAERLEANVKVALGFECPLWVPVAGEPSDLTKARHGEGNRAWSAGAGAGSLATGLTEIAWILDRIHHEVPRAESFSTGRTSRRQPTAYSYGRRSSPRMPRGIHTRTTLKRQLKHSGTRFPIRA